MTGIDKNKKSILVVDDDASIRESLSEILQLNGYSIEVAVDLTESKNKLAEKSYNVVMTDLKLPDGSGLELLKYIKDIKSEAMMIIFTGYASVESLISALNDGVFAYLQKPLNIDELKVLIEKALRMQQLSLENKELLQKLQDLSLKDVETELYNHKYLIERLTSELLRAKRYAAFISLVMIDIDYFNSVNDLYGHAYGDKILNEFAGYLKDFARRMDVVTRYGGEEFALILPDTDKQSAITFAQRLLNGIEKHTFDNEGKKIKLKISISVANFPEDNSGAQEASDMIHLAENALSFAKERGGARVVTLNGNKVESTTKDETQENVGRLQKKISRIEKRMRQTFLEAIYAFAKTIEAKDCYTGEHCENMVSLVIDIGKRLSLDEKEIENLKHAAMLHDLGKIGIPDEILLKRAKLTTEEYSVIKKHPQIGAEIIRPIHFLRVIIPMILHHHERYDGNGYLAGLKEKEIPLGARIIAIADVYQALTSDRPYRKAYSKEEALGIIKQGSGTQFDPEIVNVFLEIMDTKA